MISLHRSKPRGKSEGKLRIECSEQLKDIFDAFQQDLSSAREQGANTRDERSRFSRAWEVVWKVQKAGRARIESALGPDYVLRKLFVPAGRSFFTSMGKAVVAFEHGGFLDPLTISFGKYFLAMRDQLGDQGIAIRSSRGELVQRNIRSLREKFAKELFAGEIKVERNQEYIQSNDGRRIPFSAMSSGQQELLPLWLAVNEFMDGETQSQQIYIEEPEAHLFPFSQGILTEYLSILLGFAPGQKMIITTHSPYILATINNQLKAGSLAARASKSVQSKIDLIVPREAWLKPRSTAAYAIIDRQTVSIIGDDNLIDAEYLDEVSGKIARDFNRLLEIEYVA